MFLLQQVFVIHAELIALYGGSNGLRDLSALKSALSRPFQYFGEIELYPSPQHKAAAIIQSIILNHPFVDGNKRVGYFLAKALLLNENILINASEDEKYDFVIAVVEGRFEIEEINNWFVNHTVNNNS